MSDQHVNEGRRRLCQAFCATSGLVVLAAVPGCGGDVGTQASCSPNAVGGGDAKTLAVGQARYIEALAVFVCRDAGGYYAVDAACTHIGTDVDFVSQADGFKCALHGSTFDFNGKVLVGPATIDLPHYSLCTTSSGLLTVDTAQRVTSDTRLIV